MVFHWFLFEVDPCMRQGYTDLFIALLTANLRASALVYPCVMARWRPRR